MKIDVELIKEHLIHKLGGYTQSDMVAEISVCKAVPK